jgi:hypothetical protein
LVVIESQTPLGEMSSAARSLAMKLRVRQVYRQSPRGRFGWLCVTNNGDCLCDDLPATEETLTDGGTSRMKL